MQPVNATQTGSARGRGVASAEPPEGVRLQRAWLPHVEAETWLRRAWLELDWAQESARLFGRSHRLPRLTAFHGAAGLRYRYSGVRHLARPWPEGFAALAAAVSELAGVKLNAALANAYRDRDDRVGWHRDDEPELGPEPLVAILSFGVSRPLDFRRPLPAGGYERRRLLLDAGDLLVLTPQVQRHWQHAVPRAPRSLADGLRISLGFRRIEST